MVFIHFISCNIILFIIQVLYMHVYVRENVYLKMECVEARGDMCLPLVSESAEFSGRKEAQRGKVGQHSHGIVVVVIVRACRGIGDVVV